MRIRGSLGGLAAILLPLALAAPSVASPLLRDFDARTAAKPAAGVERELEALIRDEPDLLADVSPASGGVSFLADRGGYLTPPDPDRSPPRAIVLEWLRDNRAAVGLDRGDVEALAPATSDRSPDGVAHVVWRQTSRGIPSYDSYLKAAVTEEGRLVAISGAPVGDYRQEPAEPMIDAAGALRIARDDVGGGKSLPTVESRSADPERMTGFRGGERASLVGFADPHGGAAELSWRVEVLDRNSHLYVVVVDAESGRILARRAQTFFEDAAHVWNFHPDQTKPPLTVDLGADPTWIDRSEGGTRLRGNNAQAIIELDFPTTQEVAQSGGDWIFPAQFFSHAGCPAFGCTWENASPGTTIPVNREQTATQAFYLTNRFHDHLLSAPIGFDDASGNLEHVSSGGLGGDAVDVEASMRRSRQFQAFAATTELDGSTASTTFGRWHPPYEVHSGNSADIVYHEYSHLLTVRLLSPGVQGTNQSVAMAEGWSDFFAMDLLVHEGEVANTSGADGEVFFGAYVEQDGGVFGPEPGLRNQAIDCPVGAAAVDCPGTASAGTGGFTYGDYGNVGGDPAAVHDNGEIWGQTLWDLRERLGRADALALIVGGLRLAPSHPSFLDMRDAILQQARVLGIPTRSVWEVFAARGMGKLADDGGSGDSLDPTEDFTLPNPLEHVRTTVADPAPGGDGDGFADPGETVRIRERLENVTAATVSGASGSLSGGAGVQIGRPTAAWPPIAPGAQAENSSPFEATISPSAQCGGTAEFALEVSSPVGALAVPPLRIPIGGPAFTDSPDVPHAIPDPGTAESDVSLEAGTVRDIEVRIGGLVHPFVGDLKLTLSHGPRSVVLMENPGSAAFGAAGDNLAGLVFDDEASLPVESLPHAVPRGAVGYSGSFKPDESLSAFDGQPTAGNWTLTVEDTSANDSGTLHEWSLSSAPDCETTVPGPPARDVRPPQTRIVAGPRRSKRPTAKFRFEADEPANFECRLRGAEARRPLRSFRPCRSPKLYRNLDRGRYAFEVVATDAAGNSDPTPAKRRLRVGR